MNAAEFLLILSDNIIITIGAFLINFIVFYPFYHNRIKGLLDPLLFTIIMGACANVVPTILVITNNIETKHFVFFICSEFLFWGIYYIKTKNADKLFSKTQKQAAPVNEFGLFFICFILYLFFTLYNYKINGIPLFNANRFEINVDNSSGIMGFLGRFSSTFQLYVIMYLIHAIYLKKTRKFAIYIGITLIFCIFSGSKGFILNFVQAYFFYSVFFRANVPKVSKKMLCIIILSPVITILLASYASTFMGSIGYLAYRLLANGDVYWNGFGNAVADNIKIDSPILNMTYMFWGPFRHILGIEVNPTTMTTIGCLVFEQASGFFPEGGAPNSRLSILSWIDYKWGGLLMSAIFGYVAASMYKYCYRRKSKTIGEVCIKSLIFTASLCFISDVYLGFNSLFGIIPFALIYYGYRSLQIKNKNGEKNINNNRSVQ